MNKVNTIEEKVVELIPSSTIRMYVKEHKYNFCEIDLVKIIKAYASYFEDRLSLYQELALSTTDKNIKKLISHLIRRENASYKKFIKKEEGYAYDVQISENERYLVPTFEAAFTTIESYRRAYKKYIHKGDLDHIRIEKREIAIRPRATDVTKDQYSLILLGENLRIKEIYGSVNGVSFESFGFPDLEIDYPKLFEGKELVRFKPSWSKYTINDSVNVLIYKGSRDYIYGINSFKNSSDDVACVLFLDSPYVKNRSIPILDEYGRCPFLMSHDHIDFGELEIVQLENAPKEVAENYLYAIEELTKLNYL